MNIVLSLSSVSFKVNIITVVKNKNKFEIFFRSMNLYFNEILQCLLDIGVK